MIIMIFFENKLAIQGSLSIKKFYFNMISMSLFISMRHKLKRIKFCRKDLHANEAYKKVHKRFNNLLNF